MREFRSFSVPINRRPICFICWEDILPGETATESDGRYFCGDCLLAANLSRLDTILTGLEAQLPKIEAMKRGGLEP